MEKAHRLIVLKTYINLQPISDKILIIKKAVLPTEIFNIF
jgi:hypothetical protein